MYYLIRHHTRFRYSAPITESVMEVRMQPRTEGPQRIAAFSVDVWPQASVWEYKDYLGNTIHHFDIPRRHNSLTIKMEATVGVDPIPDPPESLADIVEGDPWTRMEEEIKQGDFWDMLNPSRFARPTRKLQQFAEEIGWGRGEDPLQQLFFLNNAISQNFRYLPQSTDADSPIDEALQIRAGVCQDFSHIMIALVREIGIPCRYVSGYLFHRTDASDRSAEDATHAWVEAYLPELGWIGFDPTNNLVAGERHIRVALGRDYADVPPTHGFFKGEVHSELDVGVQVMLTDEPEQKEELLPEIEWELPPIQMAIQQQQ